MNEILMVVDMVSREKDMDREIIFEALEAALATATRKHEHADVDVRVAIDRETGTYESFRRWEVIPDETEIVEAPDRQLLLSRARERDPAIEVGDFVEQPIASVGFNRIGAQAAKQVIVQKLREAERARVVAQYQEAVGTLVTGTVKKIEKTSDIIVEIGSAEALLVRTAMIPHEGLRKGDRIRALLEDVRSTPRGPQLFLSRVAPRLVIELFKLEVPEAGDGLLTIHASARDPGLRAKIAVSTKDPRIDPIGACVGMRGMRVQSVSNELAGERVDIIQWSNDPAQYVINALAPAEVQSIIVDEEAHSMDVIVDEQALSQAIGRGGQNVRLASELTGWEINLMTEQAANEKGEAEAQRQIRLLVDLLGVDEPVAQVLVENGLTTLDDVAYVPKQELAAIEGFDDDIADQLRNRARDVLLTRAIAMEEKIDQAHPAQNLLDMEGMDEHTARLLASNGVVTLEDLADQAVDDLLDLKLDEIDEERARKLIMTARELQLDTQD